MIPGPGGRSIPWLLLLAACTCGSDPVDVPPDLPPARYGQPVTVGHLPVPPLDEISGLAASRRGDHLWAIEDSGNPAALIALARGGALRGTVEVHGVANRDWEDLAAATLDGQPVLVIAEIGDNDARYETSWLHVVPEPDPDAERVTIALSVAFRYPGGARDAEGLAVDARGRRALILSKRDDPPALYAVPLEASEEPRVAERIAPVVHLPPPTDFDRVDDRLYGRYRHRPTALDLSPDGRRLLVQTYKDAYLYTRDGDEPWAEALLRAPRWIDTPQLAQTEAACFGEDGRTVWVTTERHPAALVRVPAAPAPD